MPEPKPKTWIVLGASGRVGRMVMKCWHKHSGSRVKFVPQFRTPSAYGLEWDVLDGSAPLTNWISGNGRVAGLLVLGGATPANPAADMALNFELIKAALLAANEAEVPRLLVASSSAVYGTSSNQAYTESSPLLPVSAYGRAKAESEELCQAASGPDLSITCLRIGNVAGADALLGGYQGQTVALDQFGDGLGPVRSYVGPETLAGIIETLACSSLDLPPALNIAAPQPVAMQSLLEAANIPWRFIPALESAVQSITLNTQLLASHYQFLPDAAQPKEMVRQWRSSGAA